MTDTADSLVGFHENEFIHNQVHLNNILLYTHEETGHITGTLIGISMACMVTHTRRLTPHQVAQVIRWDDTRHYMAPEVITMAKPPSKASDVYSFGRCMLQIMNRIDKLEHTCPSPTFDYILAPCLFCVLHKKLTMLANRCTADNPGQRMHMSDVRMNISLILDNP